MTLITKVFYWP